MSDVILYAALKENVKLQAELLEYCTSAGRIGTDFYSTPQLPGYPYINELGGTVSPTCPLIVRDWLTTLTPLVETNQPNGFQGSRCAREFLLLWQRLEPQEAAPQCGLHLAAE